MAHAGHPKAAQSSRPQSGRLVRVLRRHFALVAALLVLVLVGAGCQLTSPAQARGDRQHNGRHHRPPQTTEPEDDDGGGGGNGGASTTTGDPGAGGGTTTTVAGNTTTTADPGAGGTTTTVAGATTTTVAGATTTTADPNAPLPFSTTQCDPAGLPQASGQQTDEIGGPVCNTGILGVITGPNDIPTVKITAPADGDEFSLAAMLDPANPKPVPCEIQTNNFQGGTFDGTGKNGQARQFGLRPFSVNANGDAIGHAHCYIRDDNAGPTDQLQSFLALNQPDQGGVLAGVMPPLADAQASLGDKKMCVDLAGGNHFTWNKGVAQRFPAVDCVTIEITP